MDVTLTPDEYVRAVRTITSRQPSVRLLKVLAVIALLVFMASFFVGMDVDKHIDQPVFAVLMLTLPVLVFVVTPVMAPRTARQRWDATPAIREVISYTFTAGGVHMVAETWDANLAWSNILSAERVGDLVLLGRGQNLFNPIPTRAFESDDEWARFCRVVEANVRECRL